MILIDEDFNNSINCLIKPSKTLIALRKKGLLIIQLNNHDVVNSSFNDLNLALALSSRNVIKNLKIFKGLKIRYI